MVSFHQNGIVLSIYIHCILRKEDCSFVKKEKNNTNYHLINKISYELMSTYPIRKDPIQFRQSDLKSSPNAQQPIKKIIRIGNKFTFFDLL